MAFCKHATIDAFVVKCGAEHEMDLEILRISTNVRQEGKFHELLHVDQGNNDELIIELYA